MSNYKKFDISIIRNRIKENAYPTLAGANRAIGKTQGLSEDDKSTLKKYAAKHFGGEAPVAAAPKKKATAKKVAAPKGVAKVAKAGKKASKKAGKKGAKRVAKAAAAAPATEAEPAPASTEVTPAVAKTRRGRAPAAAKASASKQLELPLEGVGAKQSPDASTPAARTALMGSVIGSCAQMLQSITLANNIIPKDAAATGSEAATKLMTRAVSVIDQDVISPLLAQATPVKPVAATTSKKTPPPRPKNPVVAAKVAPEPTEELVSDASDDDEAGGEDLADAGEQDDPPVLTEEEERGLALLRDTMPGNVSPGMRVPPTR